jgi:hypothetical protein
MLLLLLLLCTLPGHGVAQELLCELKFGGSNPVQCPPHVTYITYLFVTEMPFSLSGLCPRGASAGGRGFGHFAPTHADNPVCWWEAVVVLQTIVLVVVGTFGYALGPIFRQLSSLPPCRSSWCCSLLCVCMPQQQRVLCPCAAHEC